jgi:GT2 family glycosyltransferase/SAM-dependent methyltransferase
MTNQNSVIIKPSAFLNPTRLCLESLAANTDLSNNEVIIVANDEEERIVEYLRIYAEIHPSVKLIFTPEKWNTAQVYNHGAALSAGENLIFLDGDAILTPDWLPVLCAHLASETAGVVGPVNNSSGFECQIRVGYEYPDEIETFARNYTAGRQGQAAEVSAVPLICFALRRSVYSAVGFLDERFSLNFFLEQDYARRIQQKNYRLLCAEDVYVHHCLDQNQPCYWPTSDLSLYRGNKELFERKWGSAWEPGMVRPEIVPQIWKQLLERNLALAEEHAAGQFKAAELEAELKAKKLELSAIHESNGWALLQAVLRFRRWLIPEGSRREKYMYSLLRSSRRIKSGRAARTPVSGQPVAVGSIHEGFADELDFWDLELGLRGLYPGAILDRSVPERLHRGYPAEITPILEKLAPSNGCPPEVLDVGSGPVSMLSYGAYAGLINLTAVDPLADKYKELLRKYGHPLQHRLVQGYGEQLAEIFPKESFDLAWIHNALDHSQSPGEVIRQMTQLLKPGGFLIFQGWSREGTAAAFTGLHHHDLYLAPGGRLMCETHLPGEPDPQVYCINEALPLELVDSTAPTAEVKKWIRLVWTKK